MPLQYSSSQQMKGEVVPLNLELKYSTTHPLMSK
jgi:hypothetical protein